jgi:hypothetical protein
VFEMHVSSQAPALRTNTIGICGGTPSSIRSAEISLSLSAANLDGRPGWGIFPRSGKIVSEVCIEKKESDGRAFPQISLDPYKSAQMRSGCRLIQPNWHERCKARVVFVFF